MPRSHSEWLLLLTAVKVRAMNNAMYIDEQQALAELCTALADSSWLALDTEFIREKTYYPKLCLLQISNGDMLACIDMLAIDDFEPLFSLLYNENITKVFHASSQDLEIFAHLRNAIPKPLFDTQLAAGLLGHGNQISYAALVKSLCDIELDKSHSRTDWTKRPLSPEQLQYAADDVHYLGDIYGQLLELLAEHDRSEWLSEDFERLTNVNHYQTEPEFAWQQVREASTLHGVQLAVLKSLASWREKRARKTDRPKRWVMKDELLIGLSQADIATVEDLETAGLSAKARDRFGEELVILIRKALATPEEQWPVLLRQDKPTAEERKLAKDLMNALQAIAKDSNIDPALLATRKIINRLVAGERDLPLLTGWRYELAGRKLLYIIDGETINNCH